MSRSSIVLSTVLGVFALVAFQPQAFAAGPDAKKDPKPAPAPAPKPAPVVEDAHAAAIKMLKALKDSADAELKALKDKNDKASAEKKRQADLKVKVGEAIMNLGHPAKKPSEKGSVKTAMTNAWVIGAIDQLSLETQREFKDALETMSKSSSKVEADAAIAMLTKLNLPKDLAKDEHPIPEVLNPGNLENFCKLFDGACKAQVQCPSVTELTRQQNEIQTLKFKAQVDNDVDMIKRCDEKLAHLVKACKTLAAADQDVKKLPTKMDPANQEHAAALEKIQGEYKAVTAELAPPKVEKEE